MKLPTKTVASLLVVTAVAATVPGFSQVSITKRRHRESQFDKLLQRHDRKGELRAEILGMKPHEFKKLLKQKSFDDIIGAAGLTKRVFRLALLGRLRNELRQRGWSARRISTYVMSRSNRGEK